MFIKYDVFFFRNFNSQLQQWNLTINFFLRYAAKYAFEYVSNVKFISLEDAWLIEPTEEPADSKEQQSDVFEFSLWKWMSLKFFTDGFFKERWKVKDFNHHQVCS